jgi:ribosomal protein S18 acetylase RimI-like enzyme
MDIIRKAEEKDYWNILELENALNNQNAELFPDIFKKSNNTVPKEIYNKEITDGNVFVFEHDGKIIGFYRAKIFEYQDDETTIYQKIYFIYSIIIKKNYQRKKFGTKLFQFIENKAKEKGCKTVELNVWENNSAIHFYKIMGMEYKYYSLRKKI